MPSKPEHLSKAAHNEQFAEKLSKDGQYANYRDWVVTAYFYSAIHYVEAFLASKSPPVHSSRHRIRDDEIATDPQLLPIYDDYRELKDHSSNARYDMWNPTPIDISKYVVPIHGAIKSHLLGVIPT